jgi:hypothetical protein
LVGSIQALSQSVKFKVRFSGTRGEVCFVSLDTRHLFHG